jgi:hypothetical protein
MRTAVKQQRSVKALCKSRNSTRRIDCCKMLYVRKIFEVSAQQRAAWCTLIACKSIASAAPHGTKSGFN